jgi:hypothetical protein
MKLKTKRNLLIFGSYVIASLAQIFCILYTHSFSFITFIGLATLNAFVIESIKDNLNGRIYVEENWLKK